MEENRTEKQDVTETAATETEIKETAVETENKGEQVSEIAAPEKPEPLRVEDPGQICFKRSVC